MISRYERDGTVESWVLLIASPNNPTGKRSDPLGIDALLAELPVTTIVLVDEVCCIY